MGKAAIWIRWIKPCAAPGHPWQWQPSVPSSAQGMPLACTALCHSQTELPIPTSWKPALRSQREFYQCHWEIRISPKSQASGFLLIIVGLLEAWISCWTNCISNISISALCFFFPPGLPLYFWGRKKRCVKFFACTGQALNWAWLNPLVTGCCSPIYCTPPFHKSGKAKNGTIFLFYCLLLSSSNGWGGITISYSKQTCLSCIPRNWNVEMFINK